MNILITGCNGQLGRTLTELLSRRGDEAVPERFRKACVTGVDVGELDISDAEAVRHFFAGNTFDLILNCAAMTNVDDCETNHETAMRVNAVGARNLALAANASGGKILHVSTDYVFSGDSNSNRPYAEWDACTPNTVYGKSKLLGEQYVREACARSFIVRTAWLYGLSGNNFVKTIIKNAKEKGKLTVVDDQKGNPTNAADLALHILKIAATDYYGIYHCTGNGICSWYEFACEIVRLSGIPCDISPCATAEFPRPAPRPSWSALEHLMLRCTVGDEMRHWKDALKDFITTLKKDGLL